MKEHGKDRLEKATYQPGDYGRMIRPDGTEQWWVRSAKGIWIAVRHQRVMPNEDGSITLLSLEIRTALHRDRARAHDPVGAAAACKSVIE